MTEATRFEPTPTELTTPFWEATRDRRLVLPWCRSCERPHWYPRWVCPHCGSVDLDWRPSAGRGRVYALSVQHRPGWPGLAEHVPYPVVIVELEEGVRMLANLVGVVADEAEIGVEVVVAWEELSDGRQLPVFSPAAGSPL